MEVHNEESQSSGSVSDVYKTDVFVDVAEEVVAAIRGQEQDDAAYERRKFRHKAHYSLNRRMALKTMPSTGRSPRRNPGAEAAAGGSVRCADAADRRPSPAYLRPVLPGHDGGRDRPDRGC